MKKHILVLFLSLGCTLLVRNRLGESVCGDGLIQEGEQCDGSNLGGNSCATLTQGSGNLTCSPECLFDLSDCSQSFCGDGVVDSAEQCDDGNLIPGDGCDQFCQLQPIPCAHNVCIQGAPLDAACDSCVALVCAQDPSCCDPAGDWSQDCISDAVDLCQITCFTCGDNNADPGEQCDGDDLNGRACGAGELLCRSDCTFDASGCLPVCGDGFVQNGEACDDGNNNNNDGCNEQCILEADLFVKCTAGVTAGDGSLQSPFTSLASAVNNAGVTGKVVMILPQSPDVCSGLVVISKSMVLQGLASRDSNNTPTPATIEGDANGTLQINGNGINVGIKDLFLQGNTDANKSVVSILNDSNLALIGVDVVNDGEGAGVDCNVTNLHFLLVDQSIIHDSQGGGLRVRNSCRAVVANSLFEGNGLSNLSRGAIEIEGGLSQANVVFSTFDGNLADNNSAVDGCDALNNSLIDSSIFNNNNRNANGATDPIDPICVLNFNNFFGLDVLAPTNINEDPLFVSGPGAPFHLEAGSPCANTASLDIIGLLFDPILDFGVDVLGHDFLGNPRPLGNRSDMGMFEDH